MGSMTVEAIQAFLPGVGWVLLSASREDPPKIVTDELVQELNLRIFERPNKLGPMFYYNRQEDAMWWEFSHSEGT